jgi:peptidyl-prolyl cis-trans isomerase D
MMSSFRRLSKSKLGTAILVIFLVAIVASFAVADIGQIRSSGALSGGTLASAGSEKIGEREYSDLAGRALTAARQQNPEATMADINAELPGLFDQMLSERALLAFANKHGFFLSKRLIDAQLAQLPQTKGLDGKFSEQAYAQFLQTQRLTDQQLRGLIRADLLQRMLLTPAAAGARVPLGVATPYASMLLEQRSGLVALVPTDAFKAGLSPSASDLQAFYAQNSQRYLQPEQRVLRMAAFGPEQLGAVKPSDAEVAAFYKANASRFAGKQTRVISQAVVADRKAAEGIAARARGGASFAAATAPAGFSAEDISVGPQTREQYRALAGEAVAAAAFAAPSGSIVGPIRSDLGWHVVKIDSVTNSAGTSLEAARPQIVAALTADKKKEVFADQIARVEDAIADGASLPEAAAAAKLTLIDTPLITAAGQSRENPAYRLPAPLAAGLKPGFALSADEDPVVEALPGDAGFVLVGVGRIVPASPAPLAQIRERVAADWIQKKANDRAKAVAQEISNKIARGADFASAVREAGKGSVALTPISARRMQLSQVAPEAATAMRMLFSLSAGKSRLAADPQGRGFFVVRTERIVPGNAASQPQLIGQTQAAFASSFGQELAAQFLAAVRADVKVKRNEDAIAAARARLLGAGGQ